LNADLGQEIVAAESEPAALKLLASGAQDAALVPLLMGAMQMREAGITNVRRVGDSIYSRDLCFAVAKGDRVAGETEHRLTSSARQGMRASARISSATWNGRDTFIAVRKAVRILARGLGGCPT
jgi:hypothetical protein